MTIGIEIGEMNDVGGTLPADAIVPVVSDGRNYSFGLATALALLPTLAQLAASGGAALIGYILNATGAVARTIYDKLTDTVNAKDFGLIDGMTAADVPINAMVAHLVSNGGGRGRINPGAFTLDNPVTFTGDGVEIVGSGRKVTGGTRLLFPGLSGRVIKNSDPTVQRSYCSLENCAVLAENMTSNKTLLDMQSFQFSALRKLRLYGSGAGSVGINIGVPTWGVTEATYNQIEDVIFNNLETGVKVFDGANKLTIEKCRFQPIAGGNGILITRNTNAPNDIVIVDNGFEFPGNVSTGITVTYGSGVRIAYNHFESLLLCVHVAATAVGDVTLIGNYYDSNTAKFLNDGAPNVVRVEEGAVTFGNGTALSRFEEGTFTPSVSGVSTAGTPTYGATRGGTYQITGDTCVIKDLTVEISGHTGTGQISIGGLPIAVKNVSDRNVPMTVLADSLTYAGTLRAAAMSGTSEIRLFSEASGAGITAVAMDTAFKVRVSGHYPI